MKTYIGIISFCFVRLLNVTSIELFERYIDKLQTQTKPDLLITQTGRTPMVANLRFVFYMHALMHGDQGLVKGFEYLILNHRSISYGCKPSSRLIIHTKLRWRCY